MATTLEQLLDTYVYTQLQDSDNKLRWTRDELTQYVNLALRDLVTRRPEAGVVVDEAYPLGTGSIQPLPETVLRLKEIVANTGLADLSFAAAVRADGYTIDMVFVATGLTEDDALAALSIDVEGVDNPIVSVSVSGENTLVIVVTDPIYNDDEVLLSFNSALGTVSDIDNRELATYVDEPVENSSALYRIRYSAVSGVYVRPMVAVRSDPSATMVAKRAVVAVDSDPSASSTQATSLVAVDSGPSASATEAHTVIAETRAPALSASSAHAIVAEDTTLAASGLSDHSLIRQTHVARASAAAMYVLIANPV